MLQVSDRRTRAAYKGTEIDHRSSTTPTVEAIFTYERKKIAAFCLLHSRHHPLLQVGGLLGTGDRPPRFLLTNCYTPGRPPSNGSSRLSRRNCRSRRDSRSALVLKEICPKVTRTYGSNYVYLRPHTWQQLHSFILQFSIHYWMVSLFPLGTSCQYTPVPRWLQLIGLYENGHSLINRAPRPICVASYQVYVYTYSCTKGKGFFFIFPSFPMCIHSAPFKFPMGSLYVPQVANVFLTCSP